MKIILTKSHILTAVKHSRKLGETKGFSIMKKIHLLSIALFFVAVNLGYAQEKDYTKPEATEVYQPVPAKVTPGKKNLVQARNLDTKVWYVHC